jgi:hypothetical protein
MTIGKYERSTAGSLAKLHYPHALPAAVSAMPALIAANARHDGALARKA